MNHIKHGGTRIMGKIFTAEDVAAGRVPNTGSLDHIAAIFQSSVRRTDSIYAGALFGSVTYEGGLEQRKDLDCLVIYDWTRRYEAVKTMQDVMMAALHLHVVVDPIFLDWTIATKGPHTLTPLLWEHFEQSILREGFIKADPLSMCLSPLTANWPVLDPRMEEIQWFRFKLSALAKGWVRWPSVETKEQCRILQKAMEAPIYAARKALTLNGFITAEDDSKQTVVEEYQRNMPEELYRMLRDIVKADADYGRVLLRFMDQSATAAEYRRSIARLVSLMPTAIEFVRANALMLNV